MNDTNAPATRHRARLPVGEALDPVDLVPYSPQAILSRTIAETDGSTLTVFAFDAGQALSEHTTPFDALMLVLEGRVRMRVGGKKFTAEGGKLVSVPAGTSHSLRAVEKFKMLLCMLRR
jgi:quercetin dioxygenase-like cupin family protein